jgi:hypothetical protein
MTLVRASFVKTSYNTLGWDEVGSKVGELLKDKINSHACQ